MIRATPTPGACCSRSRRCPAGSRAGWLELNATAAGRTLEPIPQGQDVLIVIGEGLDKAAIEARLKA